MSLTPLRNKNDLEGGRKGWAENVNTKLKDLKQLKDKEEMGIGGKDNPHQCAGKAGKRSPPVSPPTVKPCLAHST